MILQKISSETALSSICLLSSYSCLWQERGRRYLDTACDLDLMGRKADCIVLVQPGSFGYGVLQSAFLSLSSWVIWLPWSVENCLRCSEQCCQLSLWLRSMPRMLQQSWLRRMWQAWMISSGSPSSGRELSCGTSPGLPGHPLFSLPISHVHDKWKWVCTICKRYSWGTSNIPWGCQF